MLCRKSSRSFADGAAVQSGEGGWHGPEVPRRAAGSSLWADLEARPFVPWLGLPGAQRPAPSLRGPTLSSGRAADLSPSRSQTHILRAGLLPRVPALASGGDRPGARG